jgi:leucyl aminopeptidase
MKLTVHVGDCVNLAVDCLALPAFEDAPAGPSARAMDEALSGAFLSLAKDEGFRGRADQHHSTHPRGAVPARRVALFGLGKVAKLDRAAQREYGARAVRAAAKAKKVGIIVPVPADADADATRAVLQAVATGAALGAYKFDRYRTGERDKHEVKEVVLALEGKVSATTKALARAVADGQEIAAAIAYARDLVNEPPIELTPTALADEARKVAKKAKLALEALGPKEMKRGKMGLLLGVSAGSAQEPRLIHLTYRPAKAKKGTPEIALIGKGLTFDSGGLSLKPAKSMEDMKCDMAGAAAVIAAMQVIGALRPAGIVVHGLVGTTENMPGSAAIRPGDVLRSANGKTVEVLNTDAEGRLVLADVIKYARDLGVAEMIDLATLTGACMVALGRHTAGYFSNDDAMAARFDAAAKRAGEDAWRLPLVEKLAEDLRSTVADLKNIGGAYGGAITAALFLREFVGDTKWVHVDIAGPAFMEGKGPSAGGTGYGVLTIVEYVLASAR